MKNIIILLGFILASISITACGIKGPLYIPVDATAINTANTNSDTKSTDDTNDEDSDLEQSGASDDESKDIQ